MTESKKREISCRITKTLLLYVRETNEGSLGRLLDGLDLDEEYLSDSNNWVSHSFLQILYDRMIDILGDKDAVYKMTLSAGRFRSLGLLDHIVRLLGNLKFIYAQAPRYNKLLKTIGEVSIHEMGDSWIVLEDRYLEGYQKTRHDCDYTRSVLAGLPTIFDMPPAQVREIECQVPAEKYGRRIWPDNPKYGCPRCLYRIEYKAKSKVPLFKRFFSRRGIYRKAIEDLLEANRKIQEKYNEGMRLASDLEETNRELMESKRRLEASTADLRASERRYRLLAENVTDIIWASYFNSDRFEYVSPSVQRVRGFTQEEAMELGFEGTLSPQSIEKIKKVMEEEMAKEGRPGVDPKRSIKMEIQHKNSDGTYSWAESIMTYIRDQEGRAIGIQGVTRDIADRKAAEEALGAEKKLLAVTLRSIADGVISTDRDGRITLINRVAEKLTGWDEFEALGKPLEEVYKIIDEESRQPLDNPLERVMEGGTIVSLSRDTILVGRDGRECIINDSGAPIMDSEKGIIGAVLVFRDMAENRRMEKEIQKIEKLQSLGVLAGGIAHDFNNFLSGIVGNLSLAKLDLSPADKINPRIVEMEKAALRAKDLTQQLLTFSKGGDPVKKPTHMEKLIKDSAIFALRGSNVRCEFDFHPDLLSCEVDEGQITQVIHNLILNSVQAMPDGGVINVSAKNIVLPTDNELSLNPGEYVNLTIKDHGIGVSRQHIKRIFDPYFTTKHKGSGLGLAVVYSIIDKHKGRITAESELDDGTTFSILLPAIPGIEPQHEISNNTIKSGTGKVLVMDDEDFIRELASEMLKKLGYTVILAKDGEEVLSCYRQALDSGHGFDAVILDLTIPGGMGGKETIKKLLELDDTVKAIASSGYSNDPVMSNFGHYGFKNAVQKPYRIQEMSEALQAVLE